MKLVKRLVAVISSLAMVASFTTALVVNAADAKPIVTPKLVETATEGVYDLTININNTNLTAGKKLYGITLGIIIDGEKIDVANSIGHKEYDEDEEEDVLTWKYIEFATGFAPTAKSWNNNKRYGYTWYNLDGVSNSGETGTDILTIKNLKLLDGVKEDVTITLDTAVISAGKSSGQVEYSGDNVVIDYTNATIPGAPSATPTPTPVVTPEPTPTVEPTPEVTPEPVAGVEKFSDTDAAAWAWETAAVAGSKVKVTVTDGTTEGAKTFDLNAAVEGSVKVGVIVQYNPTAFPNFAIVDVEIQ